MRTRSLSLPLRSSVWTIWPLNDDIGVQPLQDIDEVNMFKDDNTVVHFKRPLSKISPFLPMVYYNDHVLFSPVLCA